MSDTRCVASRHVCPPRRPLVRAVGSGLLVRGRWFGATGRVGFVKLLRRALLALSLASLLAGGLRLRGRGGVPPQEGGWTELRVPPR